MRKLPTVPTGSGPRFVRHTGTVAFIDVFDDSGEVLAPEQMLRVVQDATLLLAREPFQTRAPEATLARLVALGVRAVLAFGFEPQIYGKLVAAGLLPLPLEEATLATLVERVATRPGDPVTVDLDRQVIETPAGDPLPFSADPRTRNKLLWGLTDLEEKVRHTERAAALRSADRAQRPWLYEDK